MPPITSILPCDKNTHLPPIAGAPVRSPCTDADICVHGGGPARIPRECHPHLTLCILRKRGVQLHFHGARSFPHALPEVQKIDSDLLFIPDHLGLIIRTNEFATAHGL